ncbi:MAG TPA: AAA family ATPase, partial [Pirellulales bacterium]|nr:AAA family ATPase [Pirellulales bacterium]
MKVDWFREVNSDNGEQSPPLPKFEDAADLIAHEMLIPPEIIEGVLHQGSKLALGGSSKSYKTHLLIDLAVGVALGIGWLGFQTVQARVLYINLEIERPFFWRRLRKICKRRNIRIPEGVLDIWNLRGHELSIQTLKEKLLAWIRAGDYALIVIDPIYKLYGEENETREIKSVLAALERLARELACAVAWAAHFSKGNQADKAAIDRISGSGVWGRDPDSILTFTRHEQDDCFIVEAVLRNFAALEDFTVKFDDGLVERVNGLDPTKFKKKAGGRKRRYSAQQLADLLGSQELSTAKFQKLAHDELGMVSSTFYDLIAEPETLKFVWRDKVSGVWE